MFFSFATLSLCIFSFKVVASAEYNLEINNFKQLVHAINIGWAHENKYKLHKNVSLIKFRAIKIRPLSFSRTLLALSAFWLTEMSMRQIKGNHFVFPKNSQFVFHVLSFVKKIKICIYFKEVYSIKQIINVSALQTGQPASAGDPTYHVNVFIHAAAHNPERATPTLGLCHGVFTDRFIFRHILGQFFTRKWNIHHAMNAFEV